MWLFTPDGFFSAVQHKDDPDKIMIRARARLHAQALVDACPEDARPEIVETPPPADYRYRVTVTRKLWVFLVAKFAADIAYLNFKNEASTREHPPGYISSLHGVWSKLLTFQDSMHDDTKQSRWGSFSHGADTDPFDGLDGWLDRRGSKSGGIEDGVEYVELAQDMIVQMADDPDMGDGEVLSVNDERGTALVHFTAPGEDGSIDEDVITVDAKELIVVYDPNDEVREALDETMPRPETETFDSMDEFAAADDGSWPPPQYSRGR